jgi:AcrR family transcriptional regulator
VDRRTQILETAAELFAKHGYHGVSINDLGAACGISGPALYKHFRGKQAILSEMLLSISEELRSTMRR